MNLSPEYSVDIIVLIKFNDKYSWYLSDKEYWVLDYVKWERGYDGLGVDDTMYGEDLRDDFKVLDSNNWPYWEAGIISPVSQKLYLATGDQN